MKLERETGELVLKTAGREVRQHKPVAYQEVGGERREVASQYVIKGKRKVGIEVGEYDRTKRLVIGPTLSNPTYLSQQHRRWLWHCPRCIWNLLCPGPNVLRWDGLLRPGGLFKRRSLRY